jgi:hypothetical protein
MTTEQQVREARSPQEALLTIARALDRIEDALTQAPMLAWDEWQPQSVSVWTSPPVTMTPEQMETVSHDVAVRQLDELRTQVTVEDGVAEVALPPVSEAKKVERRAFATHVLRLHEHLGDDENWADVYAKGGPMWLYLGNRAVVMAMPYAVKQAMIADIEEDSPQDAHEMARDILKAPCETDLGGGMRVAEGDVG